MSNDGETSKLILKTEESFPKELLPCIDIVFDDNFIKHGLSETTEIDVPSEETKDLCLHVGGIEIYRESVKTFNGVDMELRYDLMVPVNLEGSRKFTLTFDAKSLPYLCDFFYHGSTKYNLPFESKENLKFELLILNEKDSKKLVLGEEEEGNIIIIEDKKNDLFIEVEEEIDATENQPQESFAEAVKENYSSAENEKPNQIERQVQNQAQIQNQFQVQPQESELTKYEEDNSEGFRKIYGRMNVKKVAKLGLNPKELYEGNITRSSTGIEYQVTINETGNTVLRRVPSNTKNIIKPLLFIAGGAALMYFSGQDKKDELKPESKPRAIDPVIVKNPKDAKAKVKRKYTVKKVK
jgi:hypothetical protein